MSFAGAACGVRWRSTWSTVILCLVLNIAEGRLHIIAFDFEDKLLKIYSNLFSFSLFENTTLTVYKFWKVGVVTKRKAFRERDERFPPSTHLGRSRVWAVVLTEREAGREGDSLASTLDPHHRVACPVLGGRERGRSFPLAVHGALKQSFSKLAVI